VFVAFNTEEPPFIRTPNMGSQYFVDHLPQEIGSPSQLHTAIIMDLMGGVQWEPLRHVVFAAGAEKSPGLYKEGKEASREASLVKRKANPLISDASRFTLHALSVLPLGLHSVEEIADLGPV